MDTVRFFLDQHARTHAAAVSGAAEPQMEDRLLAGLTDDHLRRRPAGMNSLAWLLWHLARIEDAAISLALDQAQTLDDSWLARLGLSQRDVGTGMTDDEVTDVSARIDLPALRAYRAAVGRATRAATERLTPADLDTPASAATLARLQAEGAIGPAAADLARFWGGRPRGFLLMMPASGHNYLHIGEGWAVRGLLERQG